MWVQKSLDMKNLFLSPSKSPDFTKFLITLRMIQTEQRHARGDLAQIKHQLGAIIELLGNEETSPQTESDEQVVPDEEGI